MTTVSLRELSLERSLLKAIERKARRQGKSLSEYVRQLVERDLLADNSFDQILKPVRDDVRDRGITESDVDQVVARARKQVRRKSKRLRR